jgi:hypothetical protein
MSGVDECPLEEPVTTLDDLTLDLGAARDRVRPLTEQSAGITQADLRAMTAEIYDRLAADLDGADDAEVVFVAADSAEDGAPGWNLAHVVVHLTAGLEEQAAQACTLARGAEVTGRPRYETPWETVTTATRLRRRLAESRRMTHAFLDAWPDEPHLANIHDHPVFGPIDAVSYHALGLFHARSHLAQIAEIRRQAAAATG